MSDVTRLLAAIQQGDTRAGEELLPLVYEELRQLARAKMARERLGHTLQATALVHEAWLRLGDQPFENRAHFFGAAAEAMRQILVDSLRRRLRAKRGGGAEHANVDEIEVASPDGRTDELLQVHEVLDRFAAEAPQKAELVKLRYFAGLTLTEAAGVLGVSERTAKRHWAYARAWLFDALQREENRARD